jgi:tetratricopeptide (TPR) repeat protein
MHNIPSKYRTGFIYAALTLATLAVFWQVHDFEFTSYDDDEYVNKNTHILSGLTVENILWVFTSEHGGNWHPLTGLSHMLDCQLFGLDAGWHHLVNLLFHIANTLLLFTVLRRMTGAFWQSAFVAALFAVHPLHVESVAWISERKDVLSTLFWLLTMAAYFRYVKKPSVGWYLSALLLFALGLMSKPMLVTLPFVLLLLDYWPLNRLEVRNKGQICRLVREKIPFFILSAVSSVITFLVQKSAGAVREFETFSLTSRITNMIVSYIAYIGKLFAPSHLLVYYVHSKDKVLNWQVIAAACLLVITTVLVIRLAAKYKYLPVGWLWYLGTVVPVIGLVQVGDQGMADRYTYVPLMGLFIIAAWGTNDLLRNWRYKKIILSVLSILILLILARLTWSQAGYWRNNSTFLEYAIKPGNNLGMVIVFLENGKFYQDAIEVCKRAIETEPGYAGTYNILGSAYSKIGRYQDAIEAYNKAIGITPTAEVYNNLGVAHTQLGQLQEAIENFGQAIKIKPDYAEAYNNIGAVYNHFGWHQKAVAVYREAIKFKGGYVNAHYNLGLTFLTIGDSNSASEEYKILKALDAEKANELLNAIRN